MIVTGKEKKSQQNGTSEITSVCVIHTKPHSMTVVPQSFHSNHLVKQLNVIVVHMYHINCVQQSFI
jgi:hypothetical protein